MENCYVCRDQRRFEIEKKNKVEKMTDYDCTPAHCSMSATWCYKGEERPVQSCQHDFLEEKNSMKLSFVNNSDSYGYLPCPIFPQRIVTRIVNNN